IQHLTTLTENLPPLNLSQRRKNVQAPRHIRESRTYQFWVGSRGGGKLGNSEQYLKDGARGREFVDHCTVLWKVLGDIYGKLFPRSARTLREYQPPNDAEGMFFNKLITDREGKFLAKPWPGMTINRGCVNEPVESQPHRVGLGV